MAETDIKSELLQVEVGDPWMPELMLSGDFTVKPGTQLGPRTIDNFEIMYFPGGTSSEYNTTEHAYLLEEPCLTITRPHEYHSCGFDTSRPTRHLFIVFDFPHPEGRVWFSSLLQQHTYIKLERNSPVPTLFKHLLHLSALRNTRWKIRCAAILFTILEELRGMSNTAEGERSEEAIPLPLQQAASFMRASLKEQVAIEELAHRSGWSPAYFARAFTRFFGVSPLRYLNRLRIEQAARLLLLDTLSVKEIAKRLGFENEHYFSRLFKQVKGMPATAYREQFTDPRFMHVAISNDQETAYQTNHYYYYLEGNDYR